jgi:hypothetical protein
MSGRMQMLCTGVRAMINRTSHTCNVAHQAALRVGIHVIG